MGVESDKGACDGFKIAPDHTNWVEKNGNIMKILNLHGLNVVFAGDFTYAYGFEIRDEIQQLGGNTNTTFDQADLLICGDDPGDARKRVLPGCIILNADQWRTAVRVGEFPKGVFKKAAKPKLPENYGDW